MEGVENDWYVTGDHPMRKEDYVSFVAFATGDRLQVVKQYPEWDLQTRISGEKPRDAPVVLTEAGAAVSAGIAEPGRIVKNEGCPPPEWRDIPRFHS